jgi:hypothetical protein
MAVNWVTKTIRQMTCKKALSSGKQKQGTVRSHLKLCGLLRIAYEKGWTKGTNHCSWPFRNYISPKEKANMIADCLENQFIFHDLWDKNHE